MQDQINNLITKSDNLEKMLSLVQQDVIFFITIFLGLLTIVVAILVAVAKSASKAWVEERVKHELRKMRQEHEEFISKMEEKHKEIETKYNELELKLKIVEEEINRSEITKPENWIK